MICDKKIIGFFHRVKNEYQEPVQKYLTFRFIKSDKHMNKCWFKPKDYGWGFGVPTAWQGWVALCFLILLILTIAFVDGLVSHTNGVPLKSILRFIIDVVIISVLFCLLFQGKVEGGLKWRWGKEGQQ
ncbi:MAG: hypothetical protein HQL12_00850 [Candidatus Omnitrophica bacterium]|nr:hypothetical protein [Candidatus Omnitrophota bacterium]